MQLAYLGLEVSDPHRLSPFLSDVIGLTPGDDDGGDGTLTWRNDDKALRIAVHPGPADDATYLGFEASGATAYAQLLERLARAGLDVRPGTTDQCQARRVNRLAAVTSPWGVTVEVVEGLARAETPFASALVPGGFLTEGVGFGHVVFATTAFEESHAFVTEALGLEQSDWLETEIAEGIELEVRFYHCNPRHHTLALARAPFDLPQRLHHFMVETNDRDDVGRAFDRAWNAGLAIANGLGRHDNDGMFSFYVTSPTGFLVEVGHGARTVTDPWDGNHRYDRISAWGHQPLRQA